MIPMTTAKTPINLTCCDWMATVVTCHNLADMPFEMVDLLSVDDCDILRNALTSIYNELPDGPMCNTSATILFTKDELQVLATVVEWFEGHLVKILPMLPAILHSRHQEKVLQLTRIKFKLHVHESTFNTN